MGIIIALIFLLIIFFIFIFIAKSINSFFKKTIQSIRQKNALNRTQKQFAKRKNNPEQAAAYLIHCVVQFFKENKIGDKESIDVFLTQNDAISTLIDNQYVFNKTINALLYEGKIKKLELGETSVWESQFPDAKVATQIIRL